MSKIGIVGSGNVAQELARAFLLTGHDVKLSARLPDKKKELPDSEILNKLQITTFQDVLAFGDLIVVAIEGLAIESVFEKIDPEIVRDKIIIDVTNPLIIVDKNIRFGRATGESNGKLIQAMLPLSRVVKTLNTVNAHDMFRPDFVEGKASMLICGDDIPAKQEVGVILQSFGWQDIIDIGGIEYSFETESYVALWVRVAKTVGSFHLANKFLRG
jgi:8-hydroxy-5-deazaflavin:NADPH oxidoreductase